MKYTILALMCVIFTSSCEMRVNNEKNDPVPVKLVNDKPDSTRLPSFENLPAPFAKDYAAEFPDPNNLYYTEVLSRTIILKSVYLGDLHTMKRADAGNPGSGLIPDITFKQGHDYFIVLLKGTTIGKNRGERLYLSGYQY